MVAFFSLFRLHVYRDRVGGEGGFLENTIRINLPKGPPLGFGEICVDFWDFWRGAPKVAFLLLLLRTSPIYLEKVTICLTEEPYNLIT